MMSIAVYSPKNENLDQLKILLQDFLIECRIMAKVSFIEESHELLTAPGSYDIYIMDMDCEEDVLELGQQMMGIDVGSHFIYMSEDKDNAFLTSQIHADYFFMKPLDPVLVLKALKKIKLTIQDDNIIIKTSIGERRIRANHLNYINILRRCLCYHLTDGAMFDGQTLRTSFEKALYPLTEHPAFLFLAPSLLINIGAIKVVNNDHIIFENDDILYFPKKAYDTVREAWTSYTRFLN